jgi:hypothetical protein
LGVGAQGQQPCLCKKNLTAIETSTIVKMFRPYFPVGTKRTSKVKYMFFITSAFIIFSTKLTKNIKIN